MPIITVSTVHFNTSGLIIPAEIALASGAANDGVRSLAIPSGNSIGTGTSNNVTVSGGGDSLPGDLTVTGTTSTTNGDLVVSTPGTTISDRLITGLLEINANNCTFNNVRVRCDNGGTWGVQIGPGVTGTLLNGVEIGGGANGTTNTRVGSGILFGDNSGSAFNNQANRVWVHNCIDGLRADGNCWFRQSKVTDMDKSGYPSTHGDGSQTTGWGGIKFSHSIVWGGNNDALFFNQEPGNPSIGEVVIDNCVLNGDSGAWGNSSFGIRITAGGPCSVTNCEINGTFDNYADGIFDTWTNNRYNGTPVGAP